MTNTLPSPSVQILLVCHLFSLRYKPLWLYFHSSVAGFSLLVFSRFLYHTQQCATVGRTPLESDQLIAETSTLQHTTLTTDRHPCPRWDSNPQSQQASGYCTSITMASTLLSPIVCLLPCLIHYINMLCEYYYDTLLSPFVWLLPWLIHYLSHCMSITTVGTLFSPFIWVLPWLTHYLAPSYKYYYGQCSVSSIVWVSPWPIHYLAPLYNYYHV